MPMVQLGMLCSWSCTGESDLSRHAEIVAEFPKWDCLFAAGGVVGALSTSELTWLIGYKNGSTMYSAFSGIGWVLLYMCMDAPWVVDVARAIQGTCVGGLMVLLTGYVGEVESPTTRGKTRDAIAGPSGWGASEGPGPTTFFLLRHFFECRTNFEISTWV